MIQSKSECANCGYLVTLKDTFWVHNVEWFQEKYTCHYWEASPVKHTKKVLLFKSFKPLAFGDKNLCECNKELVALHVSSGELMWVHCDTFNVLCGKVATPTAIVSAGCP